MALTPPYAPPRFSNPLLCFLVGGIALHVATAVIWQIGDLIWVDFIHHNPNRPQSNAVLMMVLSPVYGLAFAFLGSALSVLAASIMALAAYWIWGRVPIWTLILMLPVCVYAMLVQGNHLVPPDEPIAFDYWQFLWLSKQQLPVLIGCWWCTHRTRTHMTSAE